MCKAVYNSAILDVSANSEFRGGGLFAPLCNVLGLSTLILALIVPSFASDWSTPEQDLARKVVAATGQVRVAVTFENRSSLGKRDSDIIENGLRSAMQAAGLQLVADQALVSVAISLSENPASYVWIAEIHPSTGDPMVAMVSTPRPEASGAGESFPLSLRKIPLYARDQPILDVAVLEESSTATRIAVLDPEKLSWYRMENGSWQAEQMLAIPHNQPWPRDMRGRLIAAGNHSLEAYLPGVTCQASAGSPARLDCRQSDDPWPLLPELNGTLAVFPSADVANGASTVVPEVSGFFAPTRNFFTGVLTPPIGKFSTAPKFFSSALLPRENNPLWLFAAIDGRVHMIDGVSDQITNVSWGSDLAGVKTACGSGWQVLASSAGEPAKDSIRAYEFPDRDAIAVSADVEFDGPITALWTESRGDTAVVVSRNRDSGTYEAFRLAMACGQ